MKLQSKEKSLRLFRHSRKCRSCGDPGPRGLFAGHLNNMRHSCDHHILNTFKYICTISHFETTGVKKSLLCLKDNATGFLHFFPITCCGLWLSFSLQYVNHVSFFLCLVIFQASIMVSVLTKHHPAGMMCQPVAEKGCIWTDHS